MAATPIIPATPPNTLQTTTSVNSPSTGEQTIPQKNYTVNRFLNQPYILDMVTGKKLTLQVVPLELEYDPETSWNVVAAPGRNNPLYQYTGGEDTLTFSLTWYAQEKTREDVLTQVKWLESLSKNDGYDNKPHRIQFVMGTLYSNANFIIFSAKYKLSLFQRPYNMMPTLATQELVLKRVSQFNRGSSDIQRIDT